MLTGQEKKNSENQNWNLIGQFFLWTNQVPIFILIFWDIFAKTGPKCHSLVFFQFIQKLDLEVELCFLTQTFDYVFVAILSLGADRIAPYIDHTDASRVFSEVSAALRRAQEASAEATVLLQASEKAQVMTVEA